MYFFTAAFDVSVDIDVECRFHRRIPLDSSTLDGSGALSLCMAAALEEGDGLSSSRMEARGAEGAV